MKTVSVGLKRIREYTSIICVEVAELIRIHHDREGVIEKSIPKTTVRHHEACQVMSNGDRKGRMFAIPSSQE